MSQKFMASTIGVLLCLAVPLGYAVERGGAGRERSAGRQSPGGSWSERTHQGGEGHKSYDQSHVQQRNVGATGRGNETDRRSASTSTASSAAAGAAASKR